MREPRQPGREQRRDSSHGQGHLDIEMESALRPREIQARIRAGESVDDVAKAAGVPAEKIEAFAGPVLAEREHIAGLAQKGSVRRRGETSGHRQLRIAVQERLTGRGVDVEAIAWDALRMEDGRWSVTASYASGEAQRNAIFYFDPRGRFSVAGNDEGRWVLGEQSPVHGPQPGRRPAVRGEDPDSEPTLDLNDELALVRATQELGEEADEPDLVLDIEDEAEATIVRLERAPAQEPAEPEDDATSEDLADAVGSAEAATAAGEAAGKDVAEDAGEDVAELDDASELDLLYDMLGGDGYAEDSSRVYSGLSEGGSAEPDLGWEPAVVVNYPIDEENTARTPRSPTSVTESLDESPIDEPGLAESEAILEPEQPALDEVDDPGGEEDPGPTLLEAEPVETQASDDTSQEEGAAEGEVDAEPPAPEIADPATGSEIGTSPLEPAPGSRTDNDASEEDAVPESDEAPASRPPGDDDDGRTAVEGTPEVADTPDVDDAPQVDDTPDVGDTSTAAAQPAAPKKAAAKKAAAKKRKRAEVPSWDEIMFGGPKRS